MPNYIFNDTVLTQDDIEEIASIKGYTLEELFEKNPDIKETDPDEEGKETPSQEIESAAVEESVALEPTVTDFKPVTISSDLPKVETGTVADTGIIDPKSETYKPNPKKYFNDFAESIKIEGAAGYSRGETITSAMELFNSGKDASAEQIDAYIQDNLNLAKKTMQSSIMKEWQETYDKLGGGVLGWVVATAAEPRVLPAMAVQSTALQIASLKDETVRRNAAAAAAGGATLGLVTTGGVTSLPNAIIGAFSASMGTMETALTFAELLNEATNNNLTKENIKAVLEDTEKLADIQKKAVARGIAITAVEGVTAGLAKGVGSQMFKRGAGPLSTSAAMAGTGAVGGSLGEIAGMTAAGQELEASEILFEGFTPGPASIFAGQNLVKNVKTLINEGEINNIIKPTEYTNISYAFDPIEQTTETQINIAQIQGSEEILDRNIRKEINKGNITQEQGDAIKLNFRETQGATNQIKSLRLNESDQATAVQLIKEKKKLKNQIEQVGEPNLTIEQSDRIKQIDEDLRGIKSKAVTQQVEKVREAAKDITDLDIQEFATTAETEAFLNEQNEDIKASSQQGFIIQNENGKQTIVINREIADKEEAVAAPAHEFLHAILYKTVKDSPNTALQLGNSLMEYISKIDINQVKDSNFAQRLQQYQDQPAEVQAEEALTLFSDAILTGDIKFKENIFTKLRDIISKILQVGGVKARFDTGRDVYNFIRDYNKNIQEGKLTSQQIRTAEEGVKLDIQDQAIEQAETIIKESRSEEASNKVQEIYEEKGINGALEIIEQFKPITNKIVEQRKNAPGFDRQLLTDEIETGAGGILDLIQAYDPASNVPLAAYINKFLPVRAITASRRILEEEFAGDIAEAPQVAAEAAPEAEVEATPTKAKKQVKKETLSAENQQALEDVVADLELTEDELTFKTLPNAAIEVFAKQINIPAKKFAGKANFTQAELGKVITFIEENIDIIRQALPQAAVLEGAPVSEGLIGTATGVPNNLLKDPNLYTRKERTTKKAGLVPYEKNKGIDNSSILKAIGIIEGKRTAGPRDKQAQTAKGLINVLAKFATNQEVRQQKDLTPQQKTDIETGKGSRILFSKSKSDQPLKNKHKLELYDLNTNEGQTKYLEDIENILWPVYGDVLKSGQLYGLGSNQKNEVYKKKVQALIKKLKKEKPLKTFSVPTSLNNPTGTYAYGIYGMDYNGLLKLKETGELDKLNKKNFTLWKEFWEKTNTLIKNNPKAIIPVLQLLQSATNDTTHINRVGAPLIAVDKNFKKGGKLEHAVPNVIAYMGLLDAILDPNLDFKTEFNFIKDNYKLIALSAENNKILDKLFRDKMPKNWKNWYDRYFNPELAKLGGINPVDIQSLISDKNLSVELDVNIDGSKLSKADKEAQINLSKSIKKAAVKNNKELPKKFQLPKGSTNEQVLDKMQELDNEANEARIKFSKSQNLDEAFNDIIEAKTGIETYKRFSPAKAAVRGASKGKFNFFIPPSAEDFVGLLYKTLAKGKVGNRQMQWYKDNLLDPYARAMNDISAARVAMFEDYKQLKKDLKVIPKDLKKKSVDEYTREQAVRVYIWNEQGNKIPGLFKTDQKELVDYVNNDSELKLFADQLIAMQKNDDYSSPKEGWLTGTITTDLLESVNSIKRKKYLEQWQNNVDEIFSEVNMNKLEAAFGKPYRKALENILTRMKTGRNKPFRSDTLAGRVTDWLNNSVGAIMFFNTRSAVLQTISSINFINWSDNNIYQAGKAFANQPQYWKDFKFLFNSDFLKERRGGLRFNVSESEIADMAKKGGARGVISKILQAGFLPTQAADSFAIASGGATFYRNRIKKYLKQGGKVEEELVYNASPKSFDKLGERTGLIYLATNKREAKAYADMNRGNVKNIYINKNQVASEKDLISTMEELGINTAEGSVYELIDPRFDNFYIGKDAMNKVTSALAEKGFKAAKYEDGAQVVSGKVESIVVFDKSVISDKKGTIKSGMTQKQAEAKAFTDFREIAEESQQSSRPDRISAQQAGALGRTILAFANTPAQYARLTKKAASDLINGRGDAKTNISKLLYYGAVQNLIFNTLQQAAFAIAFGDDDEDEKKKEEKYISVANGMADGLLRGIGVGGAVIATLKNALIKIIKESEKKRPDYAETAVIQLLGISPPIQSKAQKIRSALKSYEWNKKEMLEKGFSLDNPAYLAGANVISASTNIPLDRVIKKVDNVRAATRDDISKLERMMLLAGWSDWQLGIQPERKPKKKKKTRSSGRGTSRSNNRSSNRR